MASYFEEFGIDEEGNQDPSRNQQPRETMEDRFRQHYIDNIRNRVQGLLQRRSRILRERMDAMSEHDDDDGGEGEEGATDSSNFPNELPSIEQLYTPEEIDEFVDGLMPDFLQFGDQPPPPTAKAVVANLERIRIDSDDAQCPVCLRSYEKNEIAIILPCKHQSHAECILPWLNRTNSCPMCRHEMETDDPLYEEQRKEKLRAKQREAELEQLHSSMFM